MVDNKCPLSDSVAHLCCCVGQTFAECSLGGLSLEDWTRWTKQTGISEKLIQSPEELLLKGSNTDAFSIGHFVASDMIFI
jgi:hypothetical protein